MRTATVLFLLSFVVHALTAQYTLTLDEVLAQVEQNAFASQAATLQRDAARSEYALFRSRLKPQLSLNAILPDFIQSSQGVVQPNGSLAFQSVSQSNAALGLSLRQAILATGGTVFIQSNLQRFDDYSQDYHSYNGIPVRIGLSQPLLGFNAWKWQKRLAEQERELAEGRYSTDLEIARRTATRLYMDALLAHANVRIAATNKTVNENLVRIAEERYELGKISLDEKLQLDNSLNIANLDELQGQQSLQNALQDLDLFLQSNYQQLSSVQFGIPEPKTGLLIDPAEALQLAQQFSPDLRQLALQQLRAEQDMALAKANYGPSLALEASIGLARGDIELAPIYNDPFKEQQLGITLNMPLLDWGSRKHATAAADFRRQLADNQSRQGTKLLENAVLQTVQRFNQLQTELGLQQRILANAGQRFNISKERYLLGNITITELTLAQADNDQAQRNYLLALAAYWEAYYSIRVLTGFDFFTRQTIYK